MQLIWRRLGTPTGRNRFGDSSNFDNSESDFKSTTITQKFSVFVVSDHRVQEMPCSNRTDSKSLNDTLRAFDDRYLVTRFGAMRTSTNF